MNETDPDVDYKALAQNVSLNINYLNKSLNEIERLSKMADSMINFTQAVSRIFFIISIIPLMEQVLDPDINGIADIYRARLNPKNKIFSQESEISYNKINPSIIKDGRFNGREEPVFYGSLPFVTDESDPVLTAMIECCKTIFVINELDKYQKFTIGQWQVLTKFRVFNLCFDERHLILNSVLKNAKENFLILIRSKFDEKSCQLIERFHTYFSMYCTTNGSYYLTHALIFAIKMRYNQEFNGIIYPSAMTEGKGLNIFLNTNSCDNFMSLIQVRMVKCSPMKNEFNIEPCSDIIQVFNGQFDFGAEPC